GWCVLVKYVSPVFGHGACTMEAVTVSSRCRLESVLSVQHIDVSLSSGPGATRMADTATIGALKRTPFYDIRRALGAKVVPFAGYEMPVQYPTGFTAEHKAVRE